MTVGSLFAGIGGFDLAAERVGWQVKWQVEIDPFCQQVLEKHWPYVRRYRDIRCLSNWSESMSSVEDFPARTSVSREMAPACPESVQDSGGRWFTPFAWFDRSTQSWRTWQRCYLAGWALFSGTWPKQGMTRNGIAFQPDGQWGTTESASALWPTLCARDFRSGATPTRSALMRRISSRGNDLPAYLRLSIQNKSGLIDPFWAEEYMGFPAGWTELNHSATASSRKSRSGSSGKSKRVTP
jgi:hypothetical protein